MYLANSDYSLQRKSLKRKVDNAIVSKSTAEKNAIKELVKIITEKENHDDKTILGFYNVIVHYLNSCATYHKNKPIDWMDVFNNACKLSLYMFCYYLFIDSIFCFR